MGSPLLKISTMVCYCHMTYHIWVQNAITFWQPLCTFLLEGERIQINQLAVSMPSPVLIIYILLTSVLHFPWSIAKPLGLLEIVNSLISGRSKEPMQSTVLATQWGFQHVKSYDLGHCEKPLYVTNRGILYFHFLLQRTEKDFNDLCMEGIGHTSCWSYEPYDLTEENITSLSTSKFLQYIRRVETLKCI